MTFDRYWTIYEQRHGPQPQEQKDFAFQVWTASADVADEENKERNNDPGDLDDRYEDGKDEGYLYEEGNGEGYRDALDDIETWAKTDAESDPVTAESLIEHLNYVRATL